MLITEFNHQYVIDASFLISYLIPSETNPIVTTVMEQYSRGEISLNAPSLLWFEIINALRTSVVRKRIDVKQAHQLISLALRLKINIHEISFEEVLGLAIKHQLTTYDASYLHLSKILGFPLLTLDKQLQQMT